MAGIQEILTLLLIIFAIIFIPRMLPGTNTGKNAKKRKFHLSGRMRISIILSIMTPIIAALVLKPWNHNPIAFISAGIVPVVTGWAIFWIVSGFKKPDRK